jgi:threonine aldolase
VHHAPTSLICLENTHNRGGGKIYPLEIIAEIRKVALENGIPMHLDGARVMNAAVASGIKVSEYTADFDSCTLCLSKGLGAPVGSLVAGSREFIAKAYRFRKMFGGGMRQVGILAAAGIYAFKHNIERLAEDHENAKRLARGIAGTPGISIHAEEVETNLVYFTVTKKGWTAKQAAEALKKEGVLVSVPGTHSIRAVTHLDVSRQDIDEAIDVIQKVFRQ